MASLKIAMRVVAPGLSALALGCLGPNPLLGAEEAGSSTIGDTGDGDTATTGDGDGDGTTGDGDGEPDSCSNNQQDGDETDVDCGGSCGPCDDGSTCAEQTDCVSQVCSASMCQAPSCEDEVQNGDELGVDCGGPCKFCEYGSFVAELDDFEGSDGSFPRPAMFDDGSFALTYNGPMVARARWYDEFAVATAASIEISANVEFVGNVAIPVYPGEGDEHPIHVLEPGINGMAKDLILIRLTQSGPPSEFPVVTSQPVAQGELSVDGNIASIAWEKSNNIVTRRFDYGAGDWTDVNPLNGDDQNLFDGEYVSVDRNAAGVGVAAWFRTADGGGFPWTIAVRRFENGQWLGDAPVIAPAFPNGYPATEPRVAIADDGRVAVIVRLIDLEQSGVAAWILDADLVPEGPPWILQEAIPHTAGIVGSDVEALSDGSFAFVWPDPGQDRIHLRRFVGANEPKLPDVGDESLWMNITEPATAELDGIDGRLVVTWSAVVDGVRQIQGQVLSY